MQAAILTISLRDYFLSIFTFTELNINIYTQVSVHLRLYGTISGTFREKLNDYEVIENVCECNQLNQQICCYAADVWLRWW